MVKAQVVKVCAVETMKGRVRVSSVADASSIVRSEIEARGIGSAAWYRKVGADGARLLDASGVVVGHVSFNGRCWDTTGEEMAVLP